MPFAETPSKAYLPFVLLEGAYFPVIAISMGVSESGAGVITVDMPYDRNLWPRYWKIEKVSGETAPNGLARVAKATVSGIQPKTLIQIFLVDEGSGDEIFIGEGRLIEATITFAPENATVGMVAACSAYYPNEIAMYMADRGTSLQLEQNDWRGQMGTASTSDIASELESHGLTQGILTMLERVSTQSTIYLNVVWRLLRLARRLQIVDNPEALGFFQGSLIKKIFGKTVRKTSTHAPVVQIILAIMQMLRYTMVNVIAPSWKDPQWDTEGSISDVDLTNGDEVKMVDALIFPTMDQAPPPRCNVLFPCQYEKIVERLSHEKMPTRMIMRVTGTGRLDGTVNSNTLIEPEEVKQGIADNGKLFNSPEEIYRGVIHSTTSASAPEYAKDLGGDYLKEYMKQEWNRLRDGFEIQVMGIGINLRPIPGLPFLILLPNHRHVIGRLSSVNFQATGKGVARTVYSVSGCHPYDIEAPQETGTVWFDSELFAKDNVGSYIYPLIIGKHYYEHGIVGPDATDAIQEDLSILRHLQNQPGMTAEQIDEARSASDAIKNAVDLLMEEYEQTASKQEYAWWYGRRIPITRKQLLEKFYHCKCLPDYRFNTGGFSLETYSLNPPEGAEDVVIGEDLPADTPIGGCYVRERQWAYVPSFKYFQENKGLPVDVTMGVLAADFVEPTEEQLQAAAESVQNSTMNQQFEATQQLLNLYSLP